MTAYYSLNQVTTQTIRQLYFEMLPMFIRIPVLLLIALTMSACAEPPYSNLDNEQLKKMLAEMSP